MRLPRRISADGAAALLLVGAAAVLVTTPYDGGSCRNVVASHAVPLASLPDADQPAAPAALDDARAAVADAQADVTALTTERAEVEDARAAAERARAAAYEAAADVPVTSYYGDSWEVSSAEVDVDLAESQVDYAEDWLATVEEGLADTSPYGSFYTERDRQRAQEDLDEARAELAEAEQALAGARSEQDAEESAAATAERNAQDLEAAADTAEQTARDAESALTAREAEAQRRLSSARSRVTGLEAEHRDAVAGWFHEQRVAADEVTAQNNVRSSCRENGAWRAGVAGLDLLVLGALGLRRWAPGLSRLPVRLPWSRR